MKGLLVWQRKVQSTQIFRLWLLLSGFTQAYSGDLEEKVEQKYIDINIDIPYLT